LRLQREFEPLLGNYDFGIPGMENYVKITNTNGRNLSYCQIVNGAVTCQEEIVHQSGSDWKGAIAQVTFGALGSLTASGYPAKRVEEIAWEILLPPSSLDPADFMGDEDAPPPGPFGFTQEGLEVTPLAPPKP